VIRQIGPELPKKQTGAARKVPSLLVLQDSQIEAVYLHDCMREMFYDILTPQFASPVQHY
jgi:hypothetical protein